LVVEVGAEVVMVETVEDEGGAGLRKFSNMNLAEKKPAGIKSKASR
jgi:hypothetical protein